MMVLPNIFFFKGVIYSRSIFLRVLFYLLGILRTSLGRQPFKRPERILLQEAKGGARLYRSFGNKRNLISSAKVVFDPYILIKAKVDYLEFMFA